MKVFLGFRFGPEDSDLVNYCDRLIASLLAVPIAGDKLGGQALTAGVQATIDQCDALVGLLTQRDALQNGKFTTHQWVKDEIGYARANKKHAIALVEKDVDVGGMYKENEYIALDRANPLPAFIRLAETLGEWKRQIGRPVKVLVLPEPLGKKLGASDTDIECYHRLSSRGKTGPWIKVEPIPEPGGTFVWINGVQGDDELIQLKAESKKRKRWESAATSQWMRVQLNNGGG